MPPVVFCYRPPASENTKYENGDFMCDFHTMKGYELLEHKKITHAMEDYVEMITRLSRVEPVRTHKLAKRLNVRDSSASKMVANLKALGIAEAEKYGCIYLTDFGREFGEYLIHRHETLNRFLCIINSTDDETELSEKIEHFLDKRTLQNIEKWLDKFNAEKK